MPAGGIALAAVAGSPLLAPGALAVALGLGYRAYFLHGIIDTGLTFVSRFAERLDEFVHDAFDEVTVGMQYAIRGMMFSAFLLVLYFFYLTASVFVEFKKNRWPWPSPFAHSQKDVPEPRELPPGLVEVGSQLAARHAARAKGAAPHGGAPVSGAPPFESAASRLLALRAGKGAERGRAVYGYRPSTASASAQESAGGSHSHTMAMTRVAQSRLRPGHRLTFVVSTGERMHRRRTATFTKWLHDDYFEVFDEDVSGLRQYRASETYGAIYLNEPDAGEEPQRPPLGGPRGHSQPERLADGFHSGPSAPAYTVAAPKSKPRGGLLAQSGRASSIAALTDRAPSGGSVRVQEQLQDLEIDGVAVDDRFMTLPLIKLRVNPDIIPSILSVISKARHTIDTKQYLMDHREGFGALLRSIERHGTRVRILHDAGMYRKSSCFYENDRLREFAEALYAMSRSSHLEFRIYSPPDGDRRCQHTKTWLVDDSYYIGGSANFTGASEGNLEENLFTRATGVLADARAAFESAWKKGSPIPLQELLTLESRRSAPKPRSHSRPAAASSSGAA